MTDELKNIIFSPQISNVFNKHNWIINIDPNNKFHSYYVGDIANYYLKIYNQEDKIYFQFTLDTEIPEGKINELLVLINIANQNSRDGIFVFDFNVRKIKYNLIKPYSLITEEQSLYEFLKIKLNLTAKLFHNFVSGFHYLVYRENIEVKTLELLFLNNEGYA